MARWGNGYITDIEYTDGFYPAQAPPHLRLACVLNGIEPPAISDAFSYCELGCGRGVTSLVLAALNPNADFHAIDFHPAHVAHGEARAKAAGLSNITFHERSFDALLEPGAQLPMFDVVTMHGVWSWIAPELQQAIVAFLDARVRPGGIVYVSYNALPGWNAMAPLQRIVRELALSGPGRSDHAISNAIALVNRLAEANILPPRYHDGIKRLTDGPQGQGLTYLAHEYLNAHWRPLYFADVVRAFENAKLTHVGSTELLKNFSNLGMNKEQRALLAEIPAPEIRETLRDCYVDNWFRTDVFVRGARRMSEERRALLLRDISLALIRPAPEVIEIACPDQTIWRPDPAAYRLMIEALERRPCSVAELMSLPRLPRDHQVGPVELVGVFVGTGLANPWQQADAKTRETAARLNGLDESLGEIPLSRSAIVAIPSLGVGVSLAASDFDLYLALRRGEAPTPEALARRFVARCREGGGHPIVDGRPIEDEDEAATAVAREYDTKLKRVVPLWRMMEMI